MTGGVVSAGGPPPPEDDVVKVKSLEQPVFADMSVEQTR